MACGCISDCGCIVVGDGVTADVVREGDTFTVSAIPVIIDVADTPCVTLAIDDEKILTADLVLVETETVELECAESGLEANVKIDPDSTADVTVSEDGIRIDVPTAAEISGTGQPGDWIFFAGIGTRTDAIDADGEEVNRVDYPALWDALSLYGSAATRSAGVAIVTDIPTTRFMAPGMVVELTSFPFGTTIVSVDSGTTITVDNPAGNSGSDTEVRVYPHGNGDGITTFNTPDGNRKFPLGYDYIGGVVPIGTNGGLEDVTLIASEVPVLAGTVGGSASVGTALTGAGTISGSTDDPGNHTHPTATAGRHFVEVDGTPTQVAFANDSPDDLTGVFSSGDLDQLNDSTTGPEGAHTHAVSINVSDVISAVALLSGAVDLSSATVAVNAGGGSSHTNMPPHVVGRWMVHT